MSGPRPRNRRLVRLDAHHHVWDLSVRDQPWTIGRQGLHRSYAFDELRPLLQKTEMDVTVLVQTIPLPDETPELLQLAADTAEIAGVVGWVDLTAADVADRLAGLMSGPEGHRLVGIRHEVQDEADPDWLLRTDVLRGLAAVAAAGLTYDLLVLPRQLPAAVRAVRAVPQLRCILDHAAKPAIADGDRDPWAAQIAALAAEPNAAAKLSGLVTEAGPHWTRESVGPFGRHLVDVFGPDRLIFGSDWPVCTEWAGYPDILDVATDLVSELSNDEQEKVFGGNARAWYGLDNKGLIDG